MKIICISCGFSIQLGGAYDEYSGPVKCFTCGCLLQIRTVDGNLKSLEIVSAPTRTAPGLPAAASDG